MSLEDKTGPSLSNIDKDLYHLIKCETEGLLTNFETALNIMSTPGNDPDTLCDAINDYQQLTQRLLESLNIANIKIYQPLFAHVINNLDFLYNQCTPLTNQQSNIFKQWLSLFVKHLANPNEQSIHRKLATCLAEKNWLQTIDTHIANQFYRYLQNLKTKSPIDSPINNLIDFPTVYQCKQTASPSKPALPDAKQDIHAYQALSINRKNAWLNVCFDSLNLLFPQTDIITLETLEGLTVTEKSTPEYATLLLNNESIPIYALCKTLQTIHNIPDNYSKAIILKSTGGYYGILCETLATHTPHQAIEIELIPSVIRNTSSPIRFVTNCKNQVTYIIRSDDLRTYINEHYAHANKTTT